MTVCVGIVVPEPGRFQVSVVEAWKVGASHRFKFFTLKNRHNYEAGSLLRVYPYDVVAFQIPSGEDYAEKSAEIDDLVRIVESRGKRYEHVLKEEATFSVMGPNERSLFHEQVSDITGRLKFWLIYPGAKTPIQSTICAIFVATDKKKRIYQKMVLQRLLDYIREHPDGSHVPDITASVYGEFTKHTYGACRRMLHTLSKHGVAKSVQLPNGGGRAWFPL